MQHVPDSGDDSHEPVRAADGFRTGMAESLLREIAQHLATFTETHEASAIDLRSLPMTPGDRADLEERLGRGEVEAKLYVAGETEAWETRYPGVWWIRHFADGGRIAAERIEITALPEIFRTDEADIAAASARLHDELETAGPEGEHAAHV